MGNPLAGHTNSYHTYGHDEALAGIAAAGYRYVELSAVPGWTEHVDLGTPPAETRRKLEGYGLEAVSLSGHSDLTTADGLAHGIKAVQWAADYGLPIVNTAVGGHQSADENESAFLANIGAHGGRRRRGRRRRRPRDPRRHHGLERRHHPAAREDRPRLGQGQLRHGQRRVLLGRARRSTTCRRSRRISRTST